MSFSNSNLSKQKGRKILALTALNVGLEENQDIVFIGEWCRKNYRAFSDYKNIMPFYWERSDLVQEALKYCQEFYEKVLENLKNFLNEKHRLNLEKQFYRIVLGNWLITFIHVYFDRYKHLKKAIDYLGEFDVKVLSPNDFLIPYNYSEFSSFVADDFYNLQLFSQILVDLKPDCIDVSMQIPKTHVKEKFSFKKKIQRLFLRMLSCFSKGKVTLVMPYFHDSKVIAYLKLFWFSGGRFAFDDFNYSIKQNRAFNWEERKRKKIGGVDENEFERIFYKNLSQNIPVLFWEDFINFRNAVLGLKIPETKCFFTANALHGNDIFKFYYACNLPHTKMLAYQHGSGYGIDMYSVPEEYERSVSDHFITWGWKNEPTDKSLPLGLPCLKYDGRKDKILFGFNSYFRYVHRIANQPMSSFTVELVKTAGKFIRALHKKIPVKFRNHPAHSYDWCVSDRLKDELQERSFEIDTCNQSFFSELSQSRLFVTNNFGTALLESLALNFPTVFFLNREIVTTRSCLEPFLEKFRKCGILHESSEAAAWQVNQIFANIEEWWFSDSVQSARKEFCDNYVWSSPDWAKKWVKELEELV